MNSLLKDFVITGTNPDKTCFPLSDPAPSHEILTKNYFLAKPLKRV